MTLSLSVLMTLDRLSDNRVNISEEEKEVREISELQLHPVR